MKKAQPPRSAIASQPVPCKIQAREAPSSAVDAVQKGVKRLLAMDDEMTDNKEYGEVQITVEYRAGIAQKVNTMKRTVDK